MESSNRPVHRLLPARLLAVFSGVALLAALQIGATQPASAHDELIGSTPTSGEVLESAPSEITLEYSANVLELGAAMIVVDQSDVEWATSEVEVNGPLVSATFSEVLPDGQYDVRWRVVSSDGHPISGVVPFQVGDGAAAPVPSSTGPASDDSGSENSGSAAPTATAPAITEPSEEPSAEAAPSWLRTALFIGGGAIVAFLLVMLLQRRTRKDDPERATEAVESNANDEHHEGNSSN
ncbi:copper resistance CopC family protein [Humidisolicoccus flavus]|uniref:copper resistance CopC family protein n=1 Tax=Humidisolicoccus flavus TaxID=3111414 RepID=UPI00324A3DDB